MKRVAFPIEQDAGMDSEISMHFGHAQNFCIVDVDDSSNKVISHEIIINNPHSEGGCMMPVSMLKGKNVTSIVVGGIGGRPLMGLQQAGITVLHNTTSGAHVGSLVAKLPKLPVLVQSSCSHSHHAEG
jgi:predicted Fe-Mo cluster-binding NifX family protein